MNNTIDKTLGDVLDKIQGIVFLYDLQKKTFSYINEMGISLLGYSKAEIENRKDKILIDIVHPEDQKKILSNINEIIANNNNVEYRNEYRLKAKDGQYYWFDFFTYVSSTDKDGKPLMLLGNAFDISKLKTVELELRKSSKSIRNKLDAIINPDGNLNKLNLADVIDVEAVQLLMDDFYELTKIGIGIFDINNNLLVAKGWQNICLNFHRKNPSTLKYCIESDSELTRNVVPGTFKRYKCKNNMWDIVTPIYIGSVHVGNLFLGQFLFENEEPDREVFVKQARKYGFNEKEYLEALDAVPRWSEKTVNSAMSFYSRFALLISNLSYSNVKLARTIEERRIVEETLAKSEEKYRFLADNMRDVLWTFDVTTKFFTYVSPSVISLRGYSPEEIMNKPIDATMLPEQQEIIKHALNERLKLFLDDEKKMIPSRFYSEELLQPCKDGALVWTEMVTTYVRNPKSGNIEVHGVTRDISDRKKMEESLIESLERYENIVKGTNVGTWELNVQTGATIFNKQWYEMLGYHENEIQNTLNSWEALMHPDDLLKANEAMEKHFKEDVDYYELENRMRHKSGEWRWILSKGKIVSHDCIGKPLKMFGIHIDVTDKKKAEIELIRAKELAEESNNLKTSFLQNISHEIRTPLNGIIGFASLLDKPNVTDDKRKKFLEVIQNSSNQLLSIINDVLTVSSIDSKTEKLTISSLDIQELFEELKIVLSTQLKKQNNTLLIKENSINKLRIDTDKTKVTQVITNLLVNANKFTQNGFIELSAERQGEFIKFCVKDTGIGIAPENHELIFERFRQADNSIHQKFGGTGLGLSICKGFVEMLGGKIWMASDVGCGSAFFFTIPYVLAKDKVSNDNVTLNNTLTKTILIAEDEDVNLMYLQEALIEFKFNIMIARNGKEAFDICKQNKDIDLVLMDIKMPVMDGSQATKLIKCINPNLPIIAQTAFALDHEILKYMKDGFDDYLSKPIRKNDLMVKLKKYLLAE